MRTDTSFFLVLLGLSLARPADAVPGEPVPVAHGDFDGDNLTDTVQGFPEASNNAGRVDVFWGDADFRVAWPTVLSPVKDTGLTMDSGAFGAALAVGDFNGDGYDDLAIGAPNADPTYLSTTYTNAGTVTVLYGCAAACVSVDGDGAGVDAVGSPLDPTASTGADRLWKRPPYGTAVAGANFGTSLAAGDFDDDGYDDLAIGIPDDTVGGDTLAGSVAIVYGGSGGLDLGTWQNLNQDQLASTESPAEPSDRFGYAVAASRMDTDDADDLIVGVPYEDYGDFTNVGEVNVFWGATSTGITASNYNQFRHTTAMVGSPKDNDKLGLGLVAYDAFWIFTGTLYAGLAEAADCDDDPAFLAIPGGALDDASPTAVLNCEVEDVCDAESEIGDGALPEIPVHFIVIANSATVASGSLSDLPTSGWSGTDPITGESISGTRYFKSMVDLLNQQVRADDGEPVCVDDDCVRFTYQSRTYYSSTMFNSGGVNVCEKLHALSDPAGNLLSEDELAFTENCDSTTCPIETGTTRYENLSAFAKAAIDECTLLVDQDALNVLIYDVCERDAGPDGVENTSDDVMDCAGAANGRGRSNDNVPYAFVDWSRALQPRTPSTGAPYAAEEHEVGHALGLAHACDATPHGGVTHTMQTGGCTDGLGDRASGFATFPRDDLSSPVRNLIETEEMVETAREHVDAWECP